MNCPACGEGQLIFCRNMHITRKYELTDTGEPDWRTESEEVNDDDDAWVECNHCEERYDWDWVDVRTPRLKPGACSYRIVLRWAV